MEITSRKNRNQLTGNAGVNYISWKLSTMGWHVMPTVRNARGSDMFVVSPDESKTYGNQSNALSKRGDIPLGKDLEKLQSDWWIFTVNANSPEPICYVLTLPEVRALARQDKNGGAWWLPAKAYDSEKFKEAWNRLATTHPNAPASQKHHITVVKESEIRNGVRRPTLRSIKCRAVGEYLDEHPDADIAQMREVAKIREWNFQNTSIEFYQWRKFHGLSSKK
mgnify:CR=1 FL=1